MAGVDQQGGADLVVGGGGAHRSGVDRLPLGGQRSVGRGGAALIPRGQPDGDGHGVFGRSIGHPQCCQSGRRTCGRAADPCQRSPHEQGGLPGRADWAGQRALTTVCAANCQRMAIERLFASTQTPFGDGAGDGWSQAEQLVAIGHTFRPFLATQLLEQGQDIRTIQELTGHSDLNTTMSYTHVSSAALWASSAQLTRCSGRYKWIAGPITTVRHERMKPTAPAVVRSGLTESRWFTESSRSGTVVLGNHPYSVGPSRCAADFMKLA
jgi:hypothetical protein